MLFVMSRFLLAIGLLLGYNIYSTMASRTRRETNEEMLGKIKVNGAELDAAVKGFMEKVDRGDFIEEKPYDDERQPLGFGAFISAPHEHAYALELLKEEIPKAAKMLDVGCGSGYMTAVLAANAEATAKVIGIDHIKELVEKAEANAKKKHDKLLTDGQLTFAVADGRKGHPEGGPYNLIHVGAAAKEAPKELLDQLDKEGIMIMPIIGPDNVQKMTEYKKDAEGAVTNEAKEVVKDYILLQSAEEQNTPSPGKSEAPGETTVHAVTHKGSFTCTVKASPTLLLIVMIAGMRNVF